MIRQSSFSISCSLPMKMPFCWCSSLPLPLPLSLIEKANIFCAPINGFLLNGWKWNNFHFVSKFENKIVLLPLPCKFKPYREPIEEWGLFVCLFCFVLFLNYAFTSFGLPFPSNCRNLGGWYSFDILMLLMRFVYGFEYMREVVEEPPYCTWMIFVIMSCSCWIDNETIKVEIHVEKRFQLLLLYQP